MAEIIDERIFIRYLLDAQKKTTNKAMEKALFQSSGKYKASKLAKLGHPYSERNAGGWVPYSDLGRINVQRGDFYLAWMNEAPVISGDEINSRITNTSPYADRLAKGIPGKTQARPLIPRIVPVVRFWFERNTAIAIRDAIQYMR